MQASKPPSFLVTKNKLEAAGTLMVRYSLGGELSQCTPWPSAPVWRAGRFYHGALDHLG